MVYFCMEPAIYTVGVMWSSVVGGVGLAYRYTCLFTGWEFGSIHECSAIPIHIWGVLHSTSGAIGTNLNCNVDGVWVYFHLYPYRV